MTTTEQPGASLREAPADPEQREYLETYLNDHLAGSTTGLDLAKRMADRYADDPKLGPDLDRIAREIEEDRDELKQAMEQLDFSENKIKQGLAWAGEKLGRLKLNDELTDESPLSKLIELEGLRLGVEGKLGLWISLREARVSAGLPIDDLIERATRQRDTLEQYRRDAAREVFS